MRCARTITLSALLVVGALPVGAADYTPPRNPAYIAVDDFNWGGLYGGIHAGATLADFKMGDISKQMAADAYSNLAVQDFAVQIARLRTSGSDQQPHIGGFLGYNWLWEDVVIGLELDYTHLQNKLQFSDSYSDSIRRDRGLFSDAISFTTTARSQLGDYGILKMRAGYPIGRFLPFATVGLVVGKQRVSGTYTSSYSELTLDPTTGAITGTNVGPVPRNAPPLGKVGYNIGGAFGLGVDYALLDNLLLRAEYQYIGMADFRGASVTANSFRLGVGAKY